MTVPTDRTEDETRGRAETRRDDGLEGSTEAGTEVRTDRTEDWVLELGSLHSLEDDPATPGADSINLPRWSTDILPGEGSPRIRARNAFAQGRHHSTRPAPLPGAADFLPFHRNSRNGRLAPTKQTRLRNNLLAAVGFMEFANAGDFAANVWNQTPVPVYALVLMALGGTLALGMIYFAVKDARLSWGNLRALRAERAYLRSQRTEHAGNANMLQTIECFLDMNTRESGTEMVDRIGMDILLGFSALLVGVGTFMAMDGGRDGSALYRASNIMTGYLGNAPCVVFGVANVLWSSYVWMRAKKQQRAALRYVANSTRMSQMLRNRTSSLQLHAALNGFTGLVAGMAAMLTATMWWGYVILLPCVVTAGLANLFWRRRLGYERPLVTHQITMIDQDIVVDALRYADACRRRVMYGQETELMDAFTVLVSDKESLMDALEIIRINNLFENFCVRLLQDKEVSQKLFSTSSAESGDVPTIDWDELAASEDVVLTKQLLKIAEACIDELALQSFIYQERHLLELLGCYMCRGAEFGRRRKKGGFKVVKKPQATIYMKGGRHANDWLFGGFSVRETVKSLFQRAE